MMSDGVDCNLRRRFLRISVDTGADRWKADRFHLAFVGKAQTRFVTGSEQIWLAMLAVAIHGADRVKDKLRRQIPCPCPNRAAGWTTAVFGADHVELA